MTLENELAILGYEIAKKYNTDVLMATGPEQEGLRKISILIRISPERKIKLTANYHREKDSMRGIEVETKGLTSNRLPLELALIYFKKRTGVGCYSSGKEKLIFIRQE